MIEMKGGGQKVKEITRKTFTTLAKKKLETYFRKRGNTIK